MATLSDLRTYIARDLRDTTNATWSVAEIDDLANQGLDALSDVYPREIVSTFATIAASTYSYSVAATFNHLYRIDIYTSASTYRQTLPHAIGDPNSGWEMHGGVIYLPPSYTFTAGDTLRGFGYARYAQLAASTSTTDLDTTGIWAVRVFAEATAYQRLIADRAKFQQWQANTNGVDTTALGLAQLAESARRRWRDEQRRLRRMRKT